MEKVLSFEMNPALIRQAATPLKTTGWWKKQRRRERRLQQEEEKRILAEQRAKRIAEELAMEATTHTGGNRTDAVMQSLAKSSVDNPWYCHVCVCETEAGEEYLIAMRAQVPLRMFETLVD